VKLRIVLISFIVTIFIGLGINALADNLEDFWFNQELAKRPELFTASLDEKIIQQELDDLKSERELREDFKDIDINAKAAISVKVDNQGNKKILFEKNSQERLAIASLVKLMTAFIVFDLDETYNLFDLISITKESVNQEGSSKYRDLRRGEKLSVENLLYIMLLESSNDAAFALTDPIGAKTFVKMMNIYAQDMGLENTYFINPTGLEPDDPNETKNYSTTRDLVGFAEYAFRKQPRLFEFTTNQKQTIVNEDGSVHHVILENTNKLLEEMPEIIGGKTGWTPSAGGCLLIILDDPESNDYYINIVLGAKDRFAEMRKIINTIQN
jgi:D-alanyl-D-alanine carboxypeptidase